jgi:hypothetical protein
MTALRFQAKRVDDAEARVEELEDKIVIYKQAHYVMVGSICGYGEAKKAAGDMINHVVAERDSLQAKLAAATLKLCETRAYLEWPEGCTGEQIMGIVYEALEILDGEDETTVENEAS